MGYRRSTTVCRVQLLALHALSAETQALCDRLPREAGRCWSDLVQWHATARANGPWLTETDLKEQTKGGRYHLHSASVQALVEQLIANVDTTTLLRQQQHAAKQPVTAQYPHHAKVYQTITYKASAI